MRRCIATHAFSSPSVVSLRMLTEGASARVEPPPVRATAGPPASSFTGGSSGVADLRVLTGSA
jgi:hypothetical protein